MEQEHLSVMAGPTHLTRRDSRAAAPGQGVTCIELPRKSINDMQSFMGCVCGRGRGGCVMVLGPRDSTLDLRAEIHFVAFPPLPTSIHSFSFELLWAYH